MPGSPSISTSPGSARDPAAASASPSSVARSPLRPTRSMSCVTRSAAARSPPASSRRRVDRTAATAASSSAPGFVPSSAVSTWQPYSYCRRASPLASQRREQTNHHRMTTFIQRIDSHPSPSVNQCHLWRASQTLHQRGQDDEPQRAPSLPFRYAPLVKSKTCRKVQPFREFAGEQPCGLLQLQRRCRRNLASRQCRKAHEIRFSARRREGDTIPVGHQTSGAVRLEHRPKLRQAPAQCRTRVVRPLPQQVAQMLPRMRSTGRDKIDEQRAGLFRRWQRQMFPATRNAQVAQDIDR